MAWDRVEQSMPFVCPYEIVALSDALVVRWYVEGGGDREVMLLSARRIVFDGVPVVAIGQKCLKSTYCPLWTRFGEQLLPYALFSCNKATASCPYCERPRTLPLVHFCALGYVRLHMFQLHATRFLSEYWYYTVKCADWPDVEKFR